MLSAKHIGSERLASKFKLRHYLGATRLDEAQFRQGDILLFGSESGGAPDHVHARADLRVRIPQMSGTRSLNIAVAAGIALAEALRQTGRWPE